jgi:hypothetical protein
LPHEEIVHVDAGTFSFAFFGSFVTPARREALTNANAERALNGQVFDFPKGSRSQKMEY